MTERPLQLHMVPSSRTTAALQTQAVFAPHHPGVIYPRVIAVLLEYVKKAKCTIAQEISVPTGAHSTSITVEV